MIKIMFKLFNIVGLGKPTRHPAHNNIFTTREFCKARHCLKSWPAGERALYFYVDIQNETWNHLNLIYD